MPVMKRSALDQTNVIKAKNIFISSLRPYKDTNRQGIKAQKKSREKSTVKVFFFTFSTWARVLNVGVLVYSNVFNSSTFLGVFG